MRKLISLLSILIIHFSIFSQEISVNCKWETGTLNTFYNKVGKFVVEVNKSGKVLEVLLFDSNSRAEEFMKRPIGINKPNNSFDIGGIQFYIGSYNSIGYYSPNEYHSGKIKNVGNIVMEYYSPNEYNSGKLRSIGAIVLDYYSRNEYNSGKVRNIGNVIVEYYSPDEYNSGKLKSIGDVSIIYYSPHEYNSGKIKSIGSTIVEYYSPNEYNSGRFKGISRTDSRVFMITQ